MRSRSQSDSMRANRDSVSTTRGRRRQVVGFINRVNVVGVTSVVLVFFLALLATCADAGTWLRASGPKMNNVEVREAVGALFDREAGEEWATGPSHALDAQQAYELLKDGPSAPPVRYPDVMRSWVDVGVSSEFDRKELVQAMDEEDEEDEEAKLTSAPSEQKRTSFYFLPRLSASSLRYMLDNYGGSVEVVLPTIKKRLDLDGHNPFLLKDLGLTYRILGDNEKAYEAFSAALRIMPAPDLYHLTGTCLVLIERVDDAVNLFLRGLQRFPRDTSLRFSLGLAHMQNSNWRAAVSQFERIHRETPNFALINEHLAYARRQMRMNVSLRLDAAMFAVFIVGILLLAWLKCFGVGSGRHRKSNKSKLKRK